MADRLLVFANPEVQRHLREDFIPVAANDWYQRRRQDAEGEFFRKVAEQGPRRGSGTKQGHYVFSASGKLLGYNNNRGSEKRLAMMRKALAKWSGLTAAEISPKIGEEGKPDARFDRTLPEGAQVVKVFTRALEMKEGRWTALSQNKIGAQAAVDHLWFQKEEVAQLKKLIEAGGGKVPEWMKMRLARYYFRDNTRGEPRPWSHEEVVKWGLWLDQAGKLKGRFMVGGSDYGYEGRVSGQIDFDNKGAFSTFEMLVIGEHWGEGRYTKGARPGRSPLGQVYRLTPATEPRDLIPPQGMHHEQSYWNAQH